MSVRSMSQVLTEFACEYLESCIPEDVNCVVDIATVLVPEICPEGEIHSMNPVIRVGLCMEYPEGPAGEVTPLSSTSGTLPYSAVQDGDTDPLVALLDSLWESAVFLHTAYPALDSMGAVLSEFESDEDDECEEEYVDGEEDED